MAQVSCRTGVFCPFLLSPMTQVSCRTGVFYPLFSSPLVDLDPGGLPDQILAESQRLVLHPPRFLTAAGRGKELPEDEPTGREIPPVGAVGGMIPREQLPGLQGLLARTKLGQVPRPNFTPIDSNLPQYHPQPLGSRPLGFSRAIRADSRRSWDGRSDHVDASADTRRRPRSTHRRR
jgi:hypothetical protein